MSSRTMLAVVATSSLLAVANAQPGSDQPPPPPQPSPGPQQQPPSPQPDPQPAPQQPLPYAQGQVQAPGMQAPPPRQRSVMDKRWAIGINVGPETLQADVPDAPKIEFGQFEIAGRFRIRPPIELALALHLAGSKQIGQGGLYFDVRYRFYPEHKWNFYLLGGLGVIAVAHENGTEDEKRGRGSLRLGVGGERRFGSWFGLSLQLHFIHIGENKEVPALPVETDAYELARYKVGGGSFQIGGTVYF